MFIIEEFVLAHHHKHRLKEQYLHNMVCSFNFKFLLIQIKFRSWLSTDASRETTNHGVFIIGCAILLKLSIIWGRLLYNLRIQLCKTEAIELNFLDKFKFVSFEWVLSSQKGRESCRVFEVTDGERVEGTVRSVECGQFRQLPPEVTRVFTSTTTFYTVPYRSLASAILFKSF